MSSSVLPPDWIQKFSKDPYAVLGVAVTADDRRLQKRYREVAKVLHPDKYIMQDDDHIKLLAEQMMARLINPAYEELKQEKGRKEHLALLRIKVRKQTREGPLNPRSELAQKLLKHPAPEVDVFYEQAIGQLADLQYQPLEITQFESIVLELHELNRVYLQLKMGDTAPVRERRSGLVAASEAKPIQVTPTPASPEVATESYAKRHYRRAREYAKQGKWAQSIQELRDAIKLEPNASDFHALLGVSYFHQNIPAMAKVHLKRALELNPEEPLAKRYATKAGVSIPAPKPTSQPDRNEKATNGKVGNSKVGNGKASDDTVLNGTVSAASPVQSTRKAQPNSRSTSGRSSPWSAFLSGLRKLLNLFRVDKLFRRSR